jgi:hypothetical protein
MKKEKLTQWRKNWISVVPTSGLLRGVRWFGTDVSGAPICPALKSQAVQVDVWTPKTLKMGKMFGLEMSVSNHVTQRNNPEERRIQFNHGGSLRSRELNLVQYTDK